MHQHYQIHPSIAQLTVLVSSYLVAGGVIYYWIVPGLVMWAALALVFLLLVSESRCLIQQEIIYLRLDPGMNSIGFKQGKQPYFYPKYKVYQTRWFAILKLVDKDKSRALILNPDCFNSIQTYRRLRYMLRKMEHHRVA